MTSISLGVINLRLNRANAETACLVYLNKNPDFQREYEAWDDKMKTKFIETILIGRAMNPIWTITNPDEDSEEILDGMHRITTATDFLNNKFKLNGKYFTNSKYREKYSDKYFEDLTLDEKTSIRNYNFMFNTLDSSYRTDVKKRMEMYEILNRSSRELNDYEYKKVIYNPFYKLLKELKNDFKLNGFIKKKDSRGDFETEMMSYLALSSPLPNSWSSISSLTKRYISEILGESEESVSLFLENKENEIIEKLRFLLKIVNFVDNRLKNDENYKLRRNYNTEKIIICRLCFKLVNKANFNRYIEKLMKNIQDELLHPNIQDELECSQRNSTFQRKFCIRLDEIIERNCCFDDKETEDFFEKLKLQKLEEQNTKCNLCKVELLEVKYEADHIIPWSKEVKPITKIYKYYA